MFVLNKKVGIDLPLNPLTKQTSSCAFVLIGCTTNDPWGAPSYDSAGPSVVVPTRVGAIKQQSTDKAALVAKTDNLWTLGRGVLVAPSFCGRIGALCPG